MGHVLIYGVYSDYFCPIGNDLMVLVRCNYAIGVLVFDCDLLIYDFVFDFGRFAFVFHLGKETQGFTDLFFGNFFDLFAFAFGCRNDKLVVVQL